ELRRDLLGGAVEHAPEAGAVHGVKGDIGSSERLGEPGTVHAVTEAEDVRAHAPRDEGTGGDQPVAAVVALPAHHDRAAPVAAPRHPTGRPRHRPPGPLHERLDRRAGFDRAPVGPPHRLRREDRLHQPSAIATASAVESVWVSERRHSVTHRSAASSAARPHSASSGAPPGRRTTSTSRNRNFQRPTPRAFITASLAANRAARFLAGSCWRYA